MNNPPPDEAIPMSSSKRAATPTTVPTTNNTTGAARTMTIDTTIISRIPGKRSSVKCRSKATGVKSGHDRPADIRRTWAIGLMMPGTSRELLHRRRIKDIQVRRDALKISRCLRHGIMQRGN
jgi:hypothetical protein